MPQTNSPAIRLLEESIREARAAVQKGYQHIEDEECWPGFMRQTFDALTACLLKIDLEKDLTEEYNRQLSEMIMKLIRQRDTALRSEAADQDLLAKLSPNDAEAITWLIATLAATPSADRPYLLTQLVRGIAYVRKHLEETPLIQAENQDQAPG
jgi:hypothetical protein